ADVDAEMERRKLEFSAKCFDNGSFWDTSTYRDKFNSSESSYETLLKKLKEIRKKIIEKGILSKPIADKLLVMSILLKYLEERTDEAGKHVFPKDFFSTYVPGANNFIDVLKQKGACLALFNYLGHHFNGEIFKWEDEKEREILSKTDLSKFAEFFEAQTETTGQRTLWPLYSFNDLPIELISNIYEEFLGNKKGVVYTPPYLVHFLVDEAMPLESHRENFKVIDPACGSGVFLVAAYRRIIDWWRRRHDWQKPDLKTLKQLLVDSIYGVDISPEAVRLTIFSLSLVLLDELSPREIWENLKFDNLKQKGNLFEKDFFELIQKLEIDKKFDLVIGNPPFIAELETPAAKNIESNQIEKRGKLPDNQLALLFLEQAMTICKNSGLLCLIMPSGPFLYNYGAEKFRKYILESCHVIQVLDLTFLQGILFESASPAVAAVFARNEKPDSNEILHVTFRRTKAAKEKLYLELDRYEEHRVSYRDAKDSPLIWKANLLGGGRLFHLISRLDTLTKLGVYLEEKIKNNGWTMGEGFQTSSETKRLEELERRISAGETLSPDEMAEMQRLKNKLKKADYLTGKNYLPTEALTENGIDKSKIHILKEKYFHTNREKNKSIFKGPHILIKEWASRESLPIVFRDDDLGFRHKIVGIHAPVEDREKLLDIKKRIRGNRTYLFCAGAFSRQHLISRVTAILKQDIENLPYPVDENEIELSEIEQILVDDVLDYMIDFRSKGEKSKVFQTVNEEQLKVFGDIFCMILNTVYDRFAPQKPIHIHHFVCYPICYGDCPQFKTGDARRYEQNIEQLVYRKVDKALRITRMIRIYDQNVIYLVKPGLLKYWLRSVAVRDADDTFADLVKQGF
ncbi:MAG: SAM-dependent methyltransferase, partial [Candidatus Aminicenantes bacterium]|nr:SAM-dependent methyltransferase [Candidatus Aminicenantes bacterium]